MLVQRRLGGDPRQIFRAANSGTTSAIGTARCSNISASCAVIWCNAPEPVRARRAHRLRLVLRQRAARRYLAKIPGPIRTFRESSNFMPRPKAMSRSTTSKAKSAPSAACRRFSPIAFRWRWCNSIRATGEPVRDASGFCIRCATDEPGEAIGRIRDGAAKPAARFEGYTDAAESEQKILRDVFEPRRRLVSHRRSHAQGRRRFLLFRRSHRRHVPLEGRERRDLRGRRSDRSVSRHGRGDRVRRIRCRQPKARPAWRRSSPMAHWISRHCAQHLARRLPAYARPLFLRIKDRIEVTATFKHKKNELAREGYDPRQRRTRSISTIRHGRRSCRSMPRSMPVSSKARSVSAPLRSDDASLSDFGRRRIAQRETIAVRRHFEMTAMQPGKRRTVPDGDDRRTRQALRQHGVKLRLELLLDR